MGWVRMQINLLSFWVFLKTLPTGQFKTDVLNAIASLRNKYPKEPN